jgi:hypothetical protein
MLQRISFGLVALVLVLVLSVDISQAQQPTGSIEGTITDERGAALPGATVTITEKATQSAITLTTNNDGYFVARSLTPGRYDVKITQSGFASQTITDIIVQTGQVANASAQLKIGNVAETIQVTGTESQLQVDTTRQTVDGVITAQQIERLPLNGRNFLDLAQLQPSVIVRDGGTIDPTKSNAYRTVGVNGASGTATRVQVDGIDVTDETVGTTTANVSADAVQEFQLSRSSFDPSTSLTTSGAVSIVTKTGSNEFHGVGFFFYRDQNMGARPQFESQKPNDRFYRKDPGYAIGGPILKNKLFFFSNYEPIYQGVRGAVHSSNFPQFDGSVGFPENVRLLTNRLDWKATDRLTVFYSHRYSDDVSTGGSAASPFQNIDWTIVHVAGFDYVRGNTTHNYRFGYVNFNNRIESQEFGKFTFFRTPQGIPYQLNVGDISIGPNSLAPQQTYQDNYENRYDGTHLRGNHLFSFGGDVTRIILGGFANFAGPLTVGADYSADLRNSLIKAGKDPNNPLNYPLNFFQTGPNTGFFTAAPAHNLPHGGHFNTRIAGYFRDQWRARRNLTLIAGTRWEYDTGYFSPKSTPELTSLNVYGQGRGKVPRFPKDAFSPQVGFAYDLKGAGKTVIRGGFALTREMNILNNTIFDEYARLSPGIGPDIRTLDAILDPVGKPINIGALNFPGCPDQVTDGDYTCLLGQPVANVIGLLGRLHQAVQNSYANFQFDPTKGPSVFDASRGVTFGGQFPGDYRIPYAMQFNIGVQRQLSRDAVLSADYVRIRGVGLPFVLVENEHRLAASTFNAAAALARRDAFLRGNGFSSVDQAIAAGATILDFGMVSDAVFTGLTPNISRARLIQGGFSLYSGLQVKLDGRLKSSTFDFLRYREHPLINEMRYTISYALGSAKATGGSDRSEFINNVINDYNYNSAFGWTGLDNRHILTAGVNMTTVGGIELNQIWSFRTAPPQSLFVPFVSSDSDFFGGDTRAQLFTTDLNGDGGRSPFALNPDLLPGTNVGWFGRKIKSWAQLNQLIQQFNQNYAGKLTPAGQKLVDAGIFTQAQMIALGAYIKPIPLVPTTNPWPFENRFNLDLRITRPFKFAKFHAPGSEGFTISPIFEVFNVFNQTAYGQYFGLDGSFGSLNYDYTKDPQKQGGIGALNKSVRGRLSSNPANPGATRLFQVGLRIAF